MPKLYLIPWTRELCHKFYKNFENDPDIFVDMNAFSKYRYNRQKVNRYFDENQKKSRIVLYLMKGEQPIGEVKIKEIDYQKKECSLGIHMQNESVKGKGFGTKAEKLALQYAFGQLGLQTVRADVLLKNKRSQHILEKVGFVEEREDDEFRYYQYKR